MKSFQVQHGLQVLFVLHPLSFLRLPCLGNFSPFWVPAMASVDGGAVEPRSFGAFGADTSWPSAPRWSMSFLSWNYATRRDLRTGTQNGPSEHEWEKKKGRKGLMS